jgi:hypothetical protein
MVDIVSMSVGELYDFLREQDISMHDASILRTATVDGARFMEMSFDRLRRLGVESPRDLVVLIETFTTDVVAIEEQHRCVQHNAPFLPLVCSQCHINVCEKCMDTTHANHTVLGVSTAVKDCSRELSALTKDVDPVDAVSLCTTKRQALNQDVDNTRSGIENWHAAMIEAIDSRKDLMLEQLHEAATLCSAEHTRANATLMQWAAHGEVLMRRAQTHLSSRHVNIAEVRATLRLVNAHADSKPVLPDLPVLSLSLRHDKDAVTLASRVNLVKPDAVGINKLAVARRTKNYTGCFVDIYNDETGQWRPLPNTRTHRTTPALCIVESILYVIGGAPGVSADITEWIHLDDTRNIEPSWEQAPLSTGFYNDHAALFVPRLNAILVTGTSSSHTDSSIAELFTVEPKEWIRTGSMIESRYNHAMALLADGNVVVMGGSYMRDSLDTCEKFNVMTKQWEQWQDLPREVGNASAVTINNVIYLLDTTDGNAGLLSHDGTNWTTLSTSAWIESNPCFMVAWGTNEAAALWDWTPAVSVAEPEKGDKTVALPALSAMRRNIAAVSFM